MARTNIPVKCTRCRNEHMESERRQVPRGKAGAIAMSESVCPCCGCNSFYDCSPQVAWCWATGLIEIGDAMLADGRDGSGAIEIARGPKYALMGCLSEFARRGKGHSRGELLVPGVPEAETQETKGDALGAWLTWCGKSTRSRKGRDGVVFAKGFS